MESHRSGQDTVDTPGTVKAQSVRRGGGAPGTRGRTTIADGVVEKITGMAARDVSGVHAMGSGMSRTF
ncbi:Asp23/Gls24 family envelope stress response protein, partial [Streptomyces sp. SID6648]|nr:Asp23/Gls24 family envelope stress response protein [Streptomyces sp. SID6648]